ncbi:Dihydroorotate dehydrogenase B (NAD(+)), catalytic subunit [Aedoeadaptatus ivorii]|uniref:Dihydroorotate dehydrogenase n=1 Tax=Aedoeadaptatus ivorii TaxID=54006 RepID=A0A448V313_9FIRM|nr:dihydroorotate dehydrogenase [Peptoniphilus ivorii]VEJ36170.1 Dihydroorotate dehydrogenase B (NAD(+)), catalytic subunit [Peptoniphilus ivorii]
MLEVKLGGRTLKNPLIGASGTFGFGAEYARFYDPAILGGIASKGLTLRPKEGNTGVRIYETSSGIMNSIGLENPGVSAFIEEIWPEMRKIDTTVLVNLGGNSTEDYLEAAEMLNDTDIHMIELNISCPNVASGGMAFGLHCQDAAAITRAVKARTKHPVIVKLSPNGDAPAELAKACEAAGADGISLVNTFQAFAIDVDEKKAVFDNIYAGLSGPAIFPIALRMVRDVARAVSIPVVGIGGIRSAEDVIAMIMAGAEAVEIGTMNFADPHCMETIINDLKAYTARENIGSLDEIRGIV